MIVVISVASADESPVSAKLKKLWLKAPSADEVEAVQPLGECAL
jgi:hypothetical protein